MSYTCKTFETLSVAPLRWMRDMPVMIFGDEVRLWWLYPSCHGGGELVYTTGNCSLTVKQ